MPQLAGEFLVQAPGLKVDITQVSVDQTIVMLENDQLDFAISTQLKLPSNISGEPLFTDQMISVMRSGHPLGSRRFDVG
ncbi:LysR substrate-binding domain-containing protein [Pseudomonas sp. GD03842]|uniref:LysR substrate-binding domain-containing protein n=1 Tax=Pseudomonas sp. GD03842 TaxID=2975385 RepID=UPI0024491DAC|nr:LysR substrate-binding domain-containing protein [Pseudomonas sp. GD03842]MDH0746938.1 LysR substrate-binding domain-containing protein [Pseudomonas sp. GD03842]